MKEYTADAGTTILPEVDPASYAPDAKPLDFSSANDFAYIPLGQLVASLTNPRTTFDPVRLQELADSIRASGVHQPILVRPLPGARVPETGRRVQYEIVAGERRFRACQIAGLATIPAMVCDMSDGAVLEAQMVENLQRDDLSELEEAEGYDRLMHHSTLNADQVGAKIGKSRSYVYTRLKLLELCPEARTSLREGTIDASRALRIARIPDHKLQIKALAFATETSGGSDVPSVRALQIWLQQNVMLPLERAPFQITDSRLVEAAGSCKECPKRTGANPDIFADVSNADICTDPACYSAKADAHFQRLQGKAEAKGMRLVFGSEAKAACYEKSSTLNGYSPLSQVRADAGGERLDNLLGKDFEGAVLIENPWTHELIEAVPTAEAEGVLLARGLVKSVVEPKEKANKVELEIDLLKKSIEREIEKAFREEAYDAIASAVRKTPNGASTRLITSHLLRTWLISLLDNLPAQSLAELLQLTLDHDQVECVQEETVRLRIQAADGATLFQVATLFLIAEDRVLPYQLQEKNPTPLFAAAAADKCIDLPGLRAQVTKEVKARIAAEIAALKAQLKPPKGLVPTAPLAQPMISPDADANPPKALAKPSPLHKPRLSAQEAQSGIAEAIQGTLAVGVIGIGARVKVLNNVSNRYTKWIGKTGTVTKKVGIAWDVTFRGRAGGLASFDATELEWVT